MTRRRRGPRVERTADGDFALRLPPEERDLLRHLLPQLRELLIGEPDDGALRRLFPPAYANDADRDAEYQSLVHDDLLERRLAALDRVEDTLDATSLDEDQLTAWMGAINDIRLVLGTRLDVSEDQVDIDDPAAPAYVIYGYLSHLLDAMVEALMFP